MVANELMLHEGGYALHDAFFNKPVKLITQILYTLATYSTTKNPLAPLWRISPSSGLTTKTELPIPIDPLLWKSRSIPKNINP